MQRKCFLFIYVIFGLFYSCSYAANARADDTELASLLKISHKIDESLLYHPSKVIKAIEGNRKKIEYYKTLNNMMILYKTLNLKDQESDFRGLRSPVFKPTNACKWNGTLYFMGVGRIFKKAIYPPWVYFYIPFGCNIILLDLQSNFCIKKKERGLYLYIVIGLSFALPYPFNFQFGASDINLTGLTVKANETDPEGWMDYQSVGISLLVGCGYTDINAGDLYVEKGKLGILYGISCSFDKMGGVGLCIYSDPIVLK